MRKPRKLMTWLRSWPDPGHAITFYRIGGVFYVRSGWFGCQLLSSEWRCHPAGTRRTIAGHKVFLWRTTRVGWRVEHYWCLTGLGKAIDQDNAAIRTFLKDLQAL